MHGLLTPSPSALLTVTQVTARVDLDARKGSGSPFRTAHNPSTPTGTSSSPSIGRSASSLGHYGAGTLRGESITARVIQTPPSSSSSSVAQSGHHTPGPKVVTPRPASLMRASTAGTPSTLGRPGAARAKIDPSLLVETKAAGASPLAGTRSQLYSTTPTSRQNGAGASSPALTTTSTPGSSSSRPASSPLLAGPSTSSASSPHTPRTPQHNYFPPLSTSHQDASLGNAAFSASGDARDEAADTSLESVASPSPTQHQPQGLGIMSPTASVRRKYIGPAGSFTPTRTDRSVAASVTGTPKAGHARRAQSIDWGNGPTRAKTASSSDTLATAGILASPQRPTKPSFSSNGSRPLSPERPLSGAVSSTPPLVSQASFTASTSASSPAPRAAVTKDIKQTLFNGNVYSQAGDDTPTSSVSNANRVLRHATRSGDGFGTPTPVSAGAAARGHLVAGPSGPARSAEEPARPASPSKMASTEASRLRANGGHASIHSTPTSSTQGSLRARLKSNGHELPSFAATQSSTTGTHTSPRAEHVPRWSGASTDALSPGLLSPTSDTASSTGGFATFEEAVEASDAKKARKILDLEITNKSLLAINSGLEVTKLKQAREIRELRRRLREGRLSSVPPGQDGAIPGDGEFSGDDESDDGDDSSDLLPPREDPEFEAIHLRCKSLIDQMLASAREAILYEPKVEKPGTGGKVLHPVELAQMERERRKSAAVAAGDMSAVDMTFSTNFGEDSTAADTTSTTDAYDTSVAAFSSTFSRAGSVEPEARSLLDARLSASSSMTTVPRESVGSQLEPSRKPASSPFSSPLLEQAPLPPQGGHSGLAPASVTHHGGGGFRVPSGASSIDISID